MQNYKLITSPDNPRYKQLKKLATTARERRKSGQTLLDGVHLIHALADANGTVELLILREGSEQDAEIQSCLKRLNNIAGITLSGGLFDTISPVETPVGILALYSIPKRQQTDEQCAVLLENIQDPGNIGSILRTAAAAGVDAVYLSKGCAEAWSPKALRAAMGAHFVMNIFEQQDLVEQCSNFPTLIATRLDAKQSIYELDLKGKVAFLLGNEGAGLSQELSNKATDNIKIPMPGNVESLNVAAATAVCLFERVRQMQ